MSWVNGPFGGTYWQLEPQTHDKDAGTLAAVYVGLQVANEALEAVDRTLDIVAKIKGLFRRQRSGDDLAQVLASLSKVHAKLDLLLAGMAKLASRQDLEDARMRERAENVLAGVNSALIQRDLIVQHTADADMLRLRLSESLRHYLSASLELWEQAPVIVIGFVHHLDLCPDAELPGWWRGYTAAARSYLARWQERQAALLKSETQCVDDIERHIANPRFGEGVVSIGRWRNVDAWVTVAADQWRRVASKTSVVAKLSEDLVRCYDGERRGGGCTVFGRKGDVCVSNGGCHGHVNCSDFFGQVWEPYERDLQSWNVELGGLIQQLVDVQSMRKGAGQVVNVLEAFLSDPSYNAG